ncbi:hypothetical protein FOZ62_031614 [Perkinsus olseni]|uniref:Alpha-1,2-mannosidase n=1 Tax=Perkinsus olseni TaxID=32597 RepID=A0A7J6TCW1_PEROL|nr:hypothetical protein FOZ62_031614 [Perkinsus olseni]
MPILIGIILLMAMMAISQGDGILEYVNVLAGTSNSYELSTGGETPLMGRPFGFNHWSVQTEPDGQGSRYFDPSSRSFYGVRCTHQPSVWIGDYGYFLVNALISPQAFDRSQTSVSFAPLQTTYKPHYFKSSALLPDFRASAMGGVRMEMTPTEHAAFFRFSYPPGMNSRVLVRIVDGDSSTPVVLDKDGNFATRTSVNNGGVPHGFAMYIRGVVDPAPSRMHNLDGSIALDYDTAENVDRLTVHLRIATSFISDEQAQSNLDSELPAGKTFDSVVIEGEAIWRDRLSVVQFDEAKQSSRFLRTFYTNFYRTQLFPRLLGEYDEHDKVVHYSPYNGRVMPGELSTDSGFWDAYRTVYLWISFVAPDILDRLLEGWVNAYKEAGWLPTWASPGQRGSMVGTMGDVVFAWAIVANKSSHLAEEMYAAIRKDAFEEPSAGSLYGRQGLQEYAQHGFMAAHGGLSEVVSRGLNYAFADSTIAAAATVLGHHSDAEILRKRAEKALEKSFNPQNKLFEPLDTHGKWLKMNPTSWSDAYFTEASALQYRFYAPANVDFLVSKYGGKDALCGQIEEHFTKQVTPVYTADGRGVIHEETEMSLTSEDFGQYGHNNQPSHHVLGVAVAAGCFTVADKYMEKVLRELYSPEGWPGDEDNGEMAAWFMLNEMGLYEIDFGADELLLFSPLIRGDFTMALPGEGRLLRVENVHRDGCSATTSSPYVCEVHWYPSSPMESTEDDASSAFDSSVSDGVSGHGSIRGGRPHRPIPRESDAHVVLSDRRLARAELSKGGRLLFYTSSTPCE